MKFKKISQAQFCFIRIFFLLCIFLFSVAILFSAENEEAVTFRLENVPEPGSCYAFQFNRILKNNWQMKIPGIRVPAFREDSMQIQTGGIIHFLESGQKSRVLRYEIGHLSVIKNGKVLCRISKERVIANIDLKDGMSPQITLKQEFQNNDIAAFSNVIALQNEKNTSPSSGNLPEKEITAVLTFIFSSPPDSISAYLGRKISCVPGAEIPVNLDEIYRILKLKGLSVGTGKISGKAEVGKMVPFNGFNAVPLNLFMESDNIPGWDFQCQLSVLYSPEKVCLPLNIKRKALEITDRSIPWNSPLYRGNALQVIRVDQTELTMIPWK